MSITTVSKRDFLLIQKTTSRNVGPGSYNIEGSNIPNESVIPFGSTTRRNLWDLAYEPEVGPGSYDTARDRPRNGISTIPSNMRNREYFVDLHNTPSPADYAPLQEWGPKKRTTSSMRPRRVMRETPERAPQRVSPGPCDYNPEKKVAQKAHGFGRSKTPQRDPMRHNGIPGPADYTITGTRIPVNQSPAFKSKSKDGIFKPPDYDATMLDHQPWMPEVHTGRPFGSNTHRNLDFGIKGLKSDVPGPGSYVGQERKRYKKSAQAFGSTREIYKQNSDDRPGPGYYGQEIKWAKTSKSSGSRTARGELFDIPNVPGPSDYVTDRSEQIATQQKLRIASPAFKGPPDDRDILTNREPNPGPAFNCRTKSQTGVREFAKSPRFRDDEYVGNVKINPSPSPDAYSPVTPRRNTPSTIGKSSKTTPKSATSEIDPTSYQKTKSEMIKPSYNIRYDPTMKRNQKFK